MDWLATMELIGLFFWIAMLYSSVGFGGGSSYLALLALFGLEYKMLRAAALLCNITVVSGGTYIFYKKGYLKWNKILPLVLASIPLAYLGGCMEIKEQAFFILLAIVLILAAILMFWQSIMPEKEIVGIDAPSPKETIRNSALGGAIGFLSGMVGIGGGIFLAPILHLIRWDKVRTIAATASFFILVNSISGFAGQMNQSNFSIDWPLVLCLMGSVFAGGQIGSRLGASWLEPMVVRRLTAGLILFVGAKILWEWL